MSEVPLYTCAFWAPALRQHQRTKNPCGKVNADVHARPVQDGCMCAPWCYGSGKLVVCILVLWVRQIGPK